MSPVPIQTYPSQQAFGKITVAIAGTRVQGPSVPATSVILQADPGGAQSVGFGDSTIVYSTMVGMGGKLIPGASLSIDAGLIDNLNQLYFDASANGAVILYTAFK